MKTYKDYMDEIKAPEDLIRRTEEKMKEAEKRAAAEEKEPVPASGILSGSHAERGTAGKQTSRRTRYFLGAALAACLAVFVIADPFSLKSGSPSSPDAVSASEDPFAGLAWQIMTEEMYRTPEILPGQAESAGTQAGSADSFSLPAEAEPSVLFPSYELVRETEEEGIRVFFLRDENAVIRYQAAACEASVPEQLLMIPGQKYAQTDLRLGISADERTRCIVWEYAGAWFFLTAKDVPEESLKEILKNISGLV